MPHTRWHRDGGRVGLCGHGLEDQPDELPDEERVATGAFVEQRDELAPGSRVVRGTQELIGQIGDPLQRQPGEAELCATSSRETVASVDSSDSVRSAATSR